VSVRLRLLLDNDVPDSVGDVLEKHGHDVKHVRDILLPNSPDQLVAAVSELEEFILVSCDSDFRLIAPRIPKGQRARFRKLSRISIECTQPLASVRIEAAMSFIEREFEEAQKLPDKRMFIVIKKDGMKTLR
jgi:predicted nuclease of predicted toxin-antitoxin system